MKLLGVMHNEYTSVCSWFAVRLTERYVLGYVSTVCDSERSEVVQSRTTGGYELCVDAVGLIPHPVYYERGNEHALFSWSLYWYTKV